MRFERAVNAVEPASEDREDERLENAEQSSPLIHGRSGPEIRTAFFGLEAFRHRPGAQHMRDEWPTPRDVVAVDRGGVRAEVRRPGRVVNGNAADLQWALAEAIERRADLLEQFDTITTDQRLLQLAELRQPDHLA